MGFLGRYRLAIMLPAMIIPATTEVRAQAKSQARTADVQISAEPSLMAAINLPGEEAYTIYLRNNGPGIANRPQLRFEPHNIELLPSPERNCRLPQPCTLPTLILDAITASMSIFAPPALDPMVFRPA